MARSRKVCECNMSAAVTEEIRTMFVIRKLDLDVLMSCQVFFTRRLPEDFKL